MDEGIREGWLVMVKWKGGEYALRTVMFAETAEEAIQYEKGQGWCVHGWEWSAVRVAVLDGKISQSQGPHLPPTPRDPTPPVAKSAAG